MPKTLTKPSKSLPHTGSLHEAFSLLDNATSDHGYQQVAVQDQSGLNLRCITWNTMDKCHAVSDSRPYTNNPMNIDETLSQYKSRKLAQFKKIFSMIKNTPPGQNLDCIFLQEIDWTRMMNATPKGSLDKVQKELCDLFLKELSESIWGFVLSPKAALNASASQQALLTLYNNNSLNPVKDSGKGVLPAGSSINHNLRYRGYQTTFTHQSGKPIDLVNFHLNYEYDHRQDLLQVMEESIAANHTVVMGGDANHAPNFAIDTLSGEWGSATAVDKDDNVFKATGNIVMTTNHIGVQQKNIAKHYDGFCAGSPQALKIVKDGGEHFEIIDKKVKLSKEKPNPLYPFHQSEAGYPWIRGRALMVHLDKKLGQLVSASEQAALLAKMQHIAKTRFNESLEITAANKKYPLPNTQKALALPVTASLDPVDKALQTLQDRNIVLSPSALGSLREVMNRLQEGSNSCNPYYMNSSKKLHRIINALSHLQPSVSFQKELNNSSSELHKAINMQRIAPFTFWGALGFNQSKSLIKIQSTLDAEVHYDATKRYRSR